MDKGEASAELLDKLAKFMASPSSSDRAHGHRCTQRDYPEDKSATEQARLAELDEKDKISSLVWIETMLTKRSLKTSSIKNVTAI